MSQEDITRQQSLLATYRTTLFHYLRRQSMLGVAHAPPEVTHGILNARSDIKRIKNVLRNWGVIVEDHPDDEDDTNILVVSFEDNESEAVARTFRAIQSKKDMHSKHRALGGFYRETLPYIVGNLAENKATHTKIINKIGKAIQNLQFQIQQDHSALSYPDSHKDKWQKALSRDSLEQKIWIIAKELMEDGKSTFVQELDSFKKAFITQYQVSIRRKVAPYIPELNDNRAKQVIGTIEHVFATVFDLTIKGGG